MERRKKKCMEGQEQSYLYSLDRARVGKRQKASPSRFKGEELFPRGTPVWKKEKRPTSSTDMSSRR